jgi:hypothetical protein
LRGSEWFRFGNILFIACLAGASLCCSSLEATEELEGHDML